MKNRIVNSMIGIITIVSVLIILISYIEKYHREDDTDTPVSTVQYESADVHDSPVDTMVSYEKSTFSSSVETIEDVHVNELNTEEVYAIARTLYGECRGVPNDMEKAAVVWCILNRVDAGYGSIIEVVSAPRQFHGYDEDNPLDEVLISITEDVMNRWYEEKLGDTDVGRVLPKEYIYFIGDGDRNWFSVDYLSGSYWDWSLPDIYS